ncbi:MAG: hypothetical protein CVU87_07295 [Firmicutes bacterium HGW-Firmicutes-12]|jgi:hypothetical protein|nr:MAG: hypothetical protein CVU87_07295 [Firmicutes bacterium HGW-Firmicutes-12]
MEAVKDLFVLALLVYMFKKRIQIGHVFMVCAVLFGTFHTLSPLKLVSLFYTSLTSHSTLSIFLALYLITLLEKVMRKSGSQSKLVTGLVNLSGNPRITMAALPAIIGLLPSPGGARFSAPLVEEASKGIDLTGEQNAAINYYYRHLWEFFLPLYPGTLVAAEILQVPLEKYVLVMLPFTVFAIIAGVLLFRNTPSKKLETPNKSDSSAWKDVVEGLSPIVAIMLLVLVFKLNIVYALFITVACMFLYYRISLNNIFPMIVSALEIRLLYMIFSAMYLREVLVQSGSTEQMLTYFQSIGLSTLLITIIFPLMMGLLTGFTLAGVTITLPIVASLAGPDNLMALGSLAFASIIIGIILSPMHLCLLMSIEHFSADFGKTYVKLLVPEALLLLFALAYYYILPF